MDAKQIVNLFFVRLIANNNKFQVQAFQKKLEENPLEKHVVQLTAYGYG